MLFYKFKKIATVLVAAIIVAQVGWAAESQNQTEVGNYFRHLDYSRYGQLVQQTSYSNFEAQPSDTLQVSQDIYGSKTKSTKKAFLYSLVIPGSGELYGGSKLKAAVFLGAEALFWVGYFHYQGKGDDKKKEYRAYADANWDANRYRDYLISEYFTAAGFPYIYNGDTLDLTNYNTDTALYNQLRSDQDVIYNMEESLSIVDRSADTIGFTHHSVGVSRGQYYENISKYDQFTYGWGGNEQDLVPLIRSIYIGMRKTTNDFYDKAKWSAVASLGNHILSAIDAALTVKSYNRKQDRFTETSLRFRMVPEQGGISPRALLTVKF